MKKTLLIGVVILILGDLLAPWALYAVGLENVVGRPTLPANIHISEDDAGALWTEFEEEGPIKVQKLSPWSYIMMIIRQDPIKHKPPGLNLAWQVARSHNQQNLKDQRMLFWHLSGMSLAVWLTRNWTTKDIVTKIYILQQER